jgi:hypothetical protein
MVCWNDSMTRSDAVEGAGGGFTDVCESRSPFRLGWECGPIALAPFIRAPAAAMVRLELGFRLTGEHVLTQGAGVGPLCSGEGRGSGSGSSRGSSLCWPRRLGSGSLMGRARLPLTSHVDGVGGSTSSLLGKCCRSSTRGERPCVSRSSRSGSPAPTRRATVRSQALRPDEPGASQETAR